MVVGMDASDDASATTRAADLVATRWTLLVVRNLLLGRRTFRQIRDGMPGISPTVLTERLRMLERAGVLDRGIDGGHIVYDLTEMGRELEEVLLGLSAWGERWLQPPAAVPASSHRASQR
jgi:DNA-binding HxlR family transcriptional regulator